jgi:hypothetical protein
MNNSNGIIKSAGLALMTAGIAVGSLACGGSRAHTSCGNRPGEAPCSNQPPQSPAPTRAALAQPRATQPQPGTKVTLNWNCHIYHTTGGTELVWQAANPSDENLKILSVTVEYDTGFITTKPTSEMESGDYIANAHSYFSNDSNSASGNWFPTSPLAVESNGCTVQSAQVIPTTQSG